jgi:glycosyltransferase involved in cell wall biosynthesis
VTSTDLGVAIVIYEVDTRGGMERQALRLARGLAARGARVVVVTTFFPKGLGLPLPKSPPLRESRDGFEIVRVPCFRWWSGEAVYAFFELVLARILLSRERRIDLVYAVQYQVAGHVARTAAIGDFPTVLKFACGGSFGDLKQLALRSDRDELRAALGKIDRYACLSKQVLAEVAEAALPKERCLVVRNGVDTKTFSPEGPKAELGPGRWIVFLGRHDPQKRIHVLIRAFAKIAERVPDARLACAGWGPEEAALRALARDLGLAERVSFLGVRNDVPELLRAASVFVLPSAAEGLPNALLEALAVGVPSVVTNIPGTDEVVRDGEQALMVPVDDEVALAQAIERLLADEGLAKRLARAGSELVSREFDMERVVDHHVTIFESLRRPARAVVRRELARVYLRFAVALVVGWFKAALRRTRVFSR